MKSLRNVGNELSRGGTEYLQIAFFMVCSGAGGFSLGHTSTPRVWDSALPDFELLLCRWEVSQLVSEKDIKMSFNKQEILL